MSNGISATMQRPATMSNILPPVNPFLGLLPSKYWTNLKLYTAYTADFEGAFSLSGSATTTVSVNINNDSDFAVMAATAVVRSTDNTILYTYRPIKILPSDSTNNKNILVSPVMLDSFAPPAATPFYWSMLYIMTGGSVLSTQLTNLVSTNYNVSVTYHGFKIYPVAAQ